MMKAAGCLTDVSEEELERIPVTYIDGIHDRRRGPSSTGIFERAAKALAAAPCARPRDRADRN